MLTISRASAGAGKTHKLTGYYLHLLFGEYLRGREKPYRHILAVTFTNKATAEMKERIIRELDMLAAGAPSPFLGDLAAMVPDPDMTGAGREAEVREKAGVLLRSVLNDFTGFNVSTIDSFFQMILRAFAREMGQSSTYNISLDADEILAQAVDSLMASLDEDGRDDLLRWLTEMAVDEIEQGSGWDITAKLYGLGKIMFNEQYRLKGGASAMDMNTMRTLRDTLGKLRKDFAGEVASLASSSLDLIHAAGLSVTDFSGGSRSGMCSLEKLSQGEMTISPAFVKMAAAQDPSAGWMTKTSPHREVIKSLFSSSLGDRVREICALMTSDRHTDYVTASLILKNFSLLGVVNDLRAGMGKWGREHNAVILAETNDFLRRIIDSEETPFIYEKAATRIDSYMLDEFQDTSAMQWANFRPLVTDSVDSGHGCLIVGDVKQSIYRWRSSDWRLLSDVVPHEFPPRNLEMSPLSENWRSGVPVVEFNNAFFKWAGVRLQEVYDSVSGASSTTISSIYSDVEQHVPGPRSGVPGHVVVQFVPDTDDADWKQTVLEMLPDRIDSLVSRGLSCGDIALLVRSNDEGSMVSDFLISRGYSIVTEDSLRISASDSVRKVVSVLDYMLHPDDAMSALLYEQSGISLSGTLDMPLYDLCEWTISCLNEPDRRQVAFLQAFMDTVRDYVTRVGGDLGGFLRWWREYGVKLTVSAPEGVSSVRVMTIHKSKGLGIKAVIMPFLEGRLFRSGDIVWCSSDREPFTGAGVVPIVLSKVMLQSAFRQDYLDEMLYQYIDNLNMTYVAFTRAVNELYVFSRIPKKTDQIGSVGQLLYAWLSESGLLCGDRYETGAPCTFYPESPRAEDSGLFKVPENYESVSRNDRIKVSLRHADIMSESHAARLRGVLMHDIFSRIETEADASAAVEEAVAAGDLSASERDSVLSQVLERLRGVREAGYGWFDGSWQVISETPVLSPGGVETRPDRVMVKGGAAVVVDYKFGAERTPAHVRQVSGYIRSISEMGFSSVEGYLWYNEGGPVRV